jgi:hypothetical protein
VIKYNQLMVHLSVFFFKMAEAAIRYVEIELKIQFTDYKGASLSLSCIFFLGKARRHLLQYKEFLLIQMAFNMFG